MIRSLLSQKGLHTIDAMRFFPSAVRTTVLALFVAQSAHASDCMGLLEKRLPRDSDLTVTLEDSSRIASRFYGVRDSSLLLSDADSIRALAVSSVRAVEFRDHSRPRLLYVVSGFVVGTVVGSVLSDDEPTSEWGDWGAVYAGAAVGTLVGLACPIKIPYTRRVECE